MSDVPKREVSVEEPETGKIEGETRWWLVGAGVVMAVEGFSLGNLVGFSVPGIEGEGGVSILIMVIAVIILLAGVMVALIGVSNRASLGAGIGTIVAAGLSLAGVVVALFAADEVGSLLLLTGLASLVAGLKGLDLVRQVRNRSEQTS